jgi:TPR repeat protein
MRYLNGSFEYPFEPEEALRLLRHAVDLNDRDAYFELGMLYTEGLVVPRDLNKAAALIRQSATMGSDDAKHYLNRLNAAIDRSQTTKP